MVRRDGVKGRGKGKEDEEGEVVERRHLREGNRRPNGPVQGGLLLLFTHDRLYR